MLRDYKRYLPRHNCANARFTTVKRPYLDSYSYVAALRRHGNPGCDHTWVAAAIWTKWRARQFSKRNVRVKNVKFLSQNQHLLDGPLNRRRHQRERIR